MVKHMENLWKTYGIHGEPWSLKYDFLGISDSELGFLQYRWGFFFKASTMRHSAMGD